MSDGVTIQATCPLCGEVSLTPPEIELWVDSRGVHDACYRFLCPECRTTVEKPANDRVIKMLTGGGVEIRDFTMVPPPPDHPEKITVEATGGPLSLDDLIDMHELLERDDWFDALRRVDEEGA